MEDTLLIGDHVFVNREQFAPPTHWMGPLLPYRDIRRNDIVVFLSPEEQGLFCLLYTSCPWDGRRRGRPCCLFRRSA